MLIQILLLKPISLVCMREAQFGRQASFCETASAMAKARLKNFPTALAHSIFVVWSHMIYRKCVKFTELSTSSERFCRKHPSSMSKTPSNPRKVRKKAKSHPRTLLLAPQSPSFPFIVVYHSQSVDASNPALWPQSPSNARHCRVSELEHRRSIKWSAAEDNWAYL